MQKGVLHTPDFTQGGEHFMPQYYNGAGSSAKSGSKYFNLAYEPENNKNNIYARRLNQQIPDSNQLFSHNPLTKLLQPQNIAKSRRFIQDKLNISDIPGAKPDVYKKARNIEGRDYIEIRDIDGAQPTRLKQSKPMTGPDLKLYTKDINPEKWTSKRTSDPLHPVYEVPTKSGRKIRIGPIEKSQPKANVSPLTKRSSNFIRDIDGSEPKKWNAITDQQRENIMSNDMKFKRDSRQLMMKNQQEELLKQSQSFDGPVPNSHYARFQTYQQTTVNPLNDQQQSHHIQLKKELAGSRPNGFKLSSQFSKNVEQIDQIGLGLNYSVQKEANLLPTSHLKSSIPRPSNSFASIQDFKPRDIQQQNDRESHQPYKALSALIPQQSEKIPSQNAYTNLINQSLPNMKGQILDMGEKRAWSKARDAGNEIINGPELRITNSKQSRMPAGNLLGRNNFQQSIFDRGIQMNSQHHSFQNQMGTFNPINNEVMRSIDFVNRGVANQQAMINTSGSAQTLPIKSQNQSPQRNLLPPTTQKTYGNFMNSNQLDQLIRELKQTKNNPIF